METGLTQFDIDELARQGVDVTGLTVGYPATDDMRRRLGVQDDIDPGALPDPVAPAAAQPAAAQPAVAQPAMDPAAVTAAMNAAPAAPVAQGQLTAPKQGGLISGLGDMLFGPQEEVDKFSNLSRNQRMMLAFGAVKDAGFALQGKESNSFASTLKAINDQMDMGRKAKAAQAQQAMFASLTGGTGAAGVLPVNATPEQIDAHIAKLTSLLASPQGAMIQPYVTAEVARLASMKERAGERQSQMISSMAGLNATDALLASDQLDQITGYQGTWNSIKNQLGGAPEYAKLISYVDQLKGLNFLEAYQQLKGGGPVTDTEGDKATAARSRIDAALKGSPEDLRSAIMEVRELFRDALRKNPSFSGAIPSAPTATSISPEAQAIIDALEADQGSGN